MRRSRGGPCGQPAGGTGASEQGYGERWGGLWARAFPSPWMPICPLRGLGDGVGLRRFSTDKAQHVVASMLNRSSFAQRSTPHQASRLSGSTLATAPPEHSRPTLALSCKGALPSEDDSLMTDGMDRLPGGSPMQLKRVTREARNKCDASCTWSRLFGESI